MPAPRTGPKAAARNAEPHDDSTEPAARDIRAEGPAPSAAHGSPSHAVHRGKSGVANLFRTLGRDRDRPSPFAPELPSQPFGTPLDHAAFSFSAVGGEGRLGGRGALRALTWLPGTRLDITVRRRLVVVRHVQNGHWCIRPDGYLHLPAGIRRSAGLRPRDHVLLAADLAHDLLVIYPHRDIAAALWAHRPDVWPPAGSAPQDRR